MQTLTNSHFIYYYLHTKLQSNRILRNIFYLFKIRKTYFFNNTN